MSDTATLSFDLELPLHTRSGSRIGVFHQSVEVVVPEAQQQIDQGGTRVALVATLGERRYPLALEIPAEVIAECEGRSITYTHDPLVLDPAHTEEAEVLRDQTGQIVGTVKALYARPVNARP